MNTTRLLITDTETGGLNPDQHSLLSLAAAVWQDGQVIDSTEIFVCEPTFSVTAKAMEVNGIDLSWLMANGHSPKRAAVKFFAFIAKHFGVPGAIAVDDVRESAGSTSFEKVVLCGQNIGFDIGFIKRLLALAGCPQEYERTFSHRTLDIASVIRFLQLAKFPFKGGSLDDAARVLGCHTASRHSASGDVQLTVDVLNRLIRITKYNEF